MGAEGIILAKSLNSNLFRACAIMHCLKKQDTQNLGVLIVFTFSSTHIFEKEAERVVAKGVKWGCGGNG